MKRDPSNIAAAAAKFIEDGLIKAGVIENDGWKQVLRQREPGAWNGCGSPVCSLPDHPGIADDHDHVNDAQAL